MKTKEFITTRLCRALECKSAYVRIVSCGFHYNPVRQEGRSCYSHFPDEEFDVGEVDLWGGKDKEYFPWDPSCFPRNKRFG